MGAKVREKDGSYWVVVHHRGRRKWKKVGTVKRTAQKVADAINAQIALGTFRMEPEKPVPTVAESLRGWLQTYKPTLSPSFQAVADSVIERHLAPFFGALRVTDLEERHVLAFIAAKSGEGVKQPLKAASLKGILSVLRRAMALEVEAGTISRNPCRNLGRLLAKVKRQQSEEVEHVQAWDREEVATLLAVAQENETTFYPLLAFLMFTGARKGEAMAIKWEDVEWNAGRVRIRRAFSRGKLGTPKSGQARSVALSPALAAILRNLLAERRRQCLKRKWKAVPEFVFCSETGGALDERNVTRSWYRVRRKAQAKSVRPLKLHCARHTYASLALAAGKSVRWVAHQLGHASPELTLRVYAHAMSEEESDLSFLDFTPQKAAARGAKRHPRGTERRAVAASREPRRITPRSGSRKLARREGLEPPTLRFEA